MGGLIAHPGSIQAQLTTSWQQTHDGGQQGGTASAIATQHGQYLARGQGQINRANHFMIPVAGMQAANLKTRTHGKPCACN